ncbi:MAG: hypothetical protein KDJ73_09970 [Notoacmeibacter sp.]|nr:hypothetical protein [Notoacmeibacter sp.]
MAKNSKRAAAWLLLTGDRVASEKLGSTKKITETEMALGMVALADILKDTNDPILMKLGEIFSGNDDKIEIIINQKNPPNRPTTNYLRDALIADKYKEIEENLIKENIVYTKKEILRTVSEWLTDEHNINMCLKNIEKIVSHKRNNF